MSPNQIMELDWTVQVSRSMFDVLDTARNQNSVNSESQQFLNAIKIGLKVLP
jgi:hypothetical protein